MMSLRGSVLQVRAYRTTDDAERDIAATPKDGADGIVTVYDVTCLAKLPTSTGTAAAGVSIRLDNSDAEYPRKPPAAFVVSGAKPLCTHVHPEAGAICLGDHWRELNGKENLAELTLRLFAAFNFEDAPATEPGYQPQAELYRTDVLGGRPFNPSIQWPVIPSDIYRVAGSNESRPKVLLIAGATPAPVSHGLRVITPANARVAVLPRGPS